MTTATAIVQLLVLVPILIGFAVLALPLSARHQVSLALATSLLAFIGAMALAALSELDSGQMQHTLKLPWIPAFNIWYHTGVDGLSLALLLLNTFITPLVILMAPSAVEERLKQYLALFLIMSGLINGVFVALDAILFYAFFEAMLIPMFLIIGVWGGSNRVYATVKFFLYTFFGSVFFLIALIYLYLSSGSFDILSWWQDDLVLSHTEQLWLLLAFLLAFGIKVPMWPVHTWLPDAHVEAPTGGSVILAALTLKVGAYGFFRFALPVVADAVAGIGPLVVVLSLIAIVYVGFVAIAQEDMKKLIAYSSVAHMGFVTLGLFIAPGLYAAGSDAAGALALNGAFIQLVSHGLISAALFFAVGVLYSRMHTRKISDYGGVMKPMGVFGLFAVFFAMANAGFPGTSGFVAEFMVILAAIQADFLYGLIAATTLVIGAAYSLWLIKRVFYGEVLNDAVAALKDLTPRELLVFAILAIAVLIVGLAPESMLMFSRPSLAHLADFIN